MNEDPDDFDDPADISYVYSGYAPMSVRLVQCVAQKGAVLKVGEGGEAARKGKGVAGKARAHPIVGWKGFEDVLESIPGETIDIAQAGPPGTEASIAQTVASSMCFSPPLAFEIADECIQAFYPLRKRRRRSFSSLAGARTRRSLHCGGSEGRIKASPVSLRPARVSAFHNL